MDAKEFVPQDMHSMDPMEIIKKSAEQYGIKLNKPDPKCKKCGGRGWTARRYPDGAPIACDFILPEQKLDRDIGLEEQYIKPRNRAERRARARGK